MSYWRDQPMIPLNRRNCSVIAAGLLLLALCVTLMGPTIVPVVWNNLPITFLFTKVPDSALNPPIYPHANALQTIEEGNTRTMTFTTTDASSDVLDYYAGVLKSDGWVNPLINDEYPANVFEWHQGGPDGPTDTAYRLTIDTSVVQTGTTGVQIRVVKF